MNLRVLVGIVCVQRQFLVQAGPAHPTPHGAVDPVQQWVAVDAPVPQGKQAVADRSPKELGVKIKKSEIIFHHEITNQLLWGQF